MSTKNDKFNQKDYKYYMNLAIEFSKTNGMV